MLGTYVLSSGYYDAYYAKAQKVRALVKRDYQIAFEKCDAILTPTSPTVAFKIGERSDDPLAMYLSDIYTVSANLAGVPAISVPCGLSGEGLPIGVQLVGNFWSEGVLLNLAAAYETAHPLGERPRICIG
jgi:aspartyl-tRNA(Asn)/glutamyl-tRNA(Gln) amidotransferase subunit A